ncbi:hypothetical protein Cs7R123_01830 [Catellatospora sp. TT07R-123]|uniref:VWA domain-containing protein n=1 Tax=Catellatospora sp. TT07R-123 TaxID=2733863 RepID=UPI001B008766|nr:vWA domain-containing protein [Catellatospora sp. TT07R-123]GHJ42841.1 hypothetical protein Cs7R123_01830 [Catellatospora sp. TT07R-123]
MISSKDHRAVGLPARGLISGQRIGVAPNAGTSGPALLTVAAAGGSRHTAVDLVSHPDVPARTLAVGEDLFHQLNLGDDVPWSISTRPVVEASQLVLELPTELKPEEIEQTKTQIAGAGLAGSLLWVASSGGDLLLDVADVPYRVTEVGTGGQRDVIARIGPRTRIELFAPGVKAGVDIVILADCSGSMDTEDIPIPRESALALRRTGEIRRMEALQQALRDLLEVRLRVSGRVSRIAMLGFNTAATPRFPRQGGMAQLDGDSPPEVIAQFRDAITLLRADGGTSIGNALHAAADLIYQHGRPGNDRLVILVSDGADWVPRGEKATGEILEATTEPVSLMTHLHRDMHIRLHALGISTRELYLRKYRDQVGFTPNHDLLQELVNVGGGDPTAIGGLDVLVEYFSGVGAGVTHRVRGPLSAPAQQQLDTAARDLLRAASTRHGAAHINHELEEIATAHDRVETIALRVFAGPVVARREFVMALAPLREQLDPAELPGVLRRSLRRLAPALPEAAQPPTVRSWASLVGSLAGMVSGDSPDLRGLGIMCQATSEAPIDLAGAVLRRLTLALAAIADEIDRLPDRAEPAAPAGQAAPTGSAATTVPDGDSRRAAATEVDDLPLTRPDTGTTLPQQSKPAAGGFVYRD